MSQLPPLAPPTTASLAAFVGIVAVVAACMPAGVHYAWRATGATVLEARRAGLVALAVTALVMAVSGIAATSGFLARPGLPPKVMLVFGGSMVLAATVALSPVGRRLAAGVPVVALVGFQAFRLPLELVLHSWVGSGTIPVQMTWSGHNFDIVTGIAAVVVAALLWRGARARPLVATFTALGLVLLAAVSVIAILSLPTPLRAYHNEPALLLGYHVPYVWIVPVCVAGALFGHLVTLRWLLGAPRTADAPLPVEGQVR